MIKNGMRASHPGGVLRDGSMLPLGSSVHALVLSIGVTLARINDVVRGRRRITGNTELQLPRCFGTDARTWLNLQSSYEVRLAEIEVGDSIERHVKPRAA